MTVALSDMEIRVLRACAGEFSPLPYNNAQKEAQDSLLHGGLIKKAIEDDQPTCIATQRGRDLLSSIGVTNHDN